MNIENIFFVILLTATGLMLFVAYLCFRKWHLTTAKYMAFVMIAASIYSFGYAFELLSNDLESVKFWLKIEYIGIPFISTLWFMLVLHFTGYQYLLKKWVIILFFIIPVLTFLIHYTNDLHYFYYHDIQLIDKSLYHEVYLTKGPWYWVHIYYNYIQATVGMLLYLAMYLRAKSIVRKQIAMMLLGVSAPWLANIIYLFGDFERLFDLTPIGFALTGIFYIWAIYRFNLNRLVPIAMEAVFETMQDGVIILDYEDNVINVNQAAREMFEKVHPITMNNESVHHIFSNYPDVLKHVLTNDQNVDRIIVRKETGNRYYNLKKSIVYERGQIVLGKMIIIHDVTDVTLYQEQLLANANQLAELSAFKDNLFTVVAHDIRDPLAVLMNLTDLLAEELVDIDSDELSIFHEVSGQVKNTFMIVENLLDWYRSQQGKMIFNPLLWNLTTIVNQSMDTLKIQCELKKIQLSSTVDEGIQIYADKEMVDLIIRNLLSNAIKFTNVGGKIHIEAFMDKDKVIVSVKDSGVGVNPEVAKSLFLEAQKVSAMGTDGEQGTGLGLYLVGKFVQINGGEIWFENNEDKGSTFSLSLPSKCV